MRTCSHIRSLLITLVIAVLAAVPAATAAYAHSCCIEDAAQVSDGDERVRHGSHFVADDHSGMKHMQPHQSTSDSDCEAVCCGSLVAYGLGFDAPMLADSWDGPEHLKAIDNIAISAVAGHTTPPPRFI